MQNHLPTCDAHPLSLEKPMTLVRTSAKVEGHLPSYLKMPIRSVDFANTLPRDRF